MNSNWKLLPAALLVAVLAMAGCGGGSDDTSGTTPPDTTDPMPPEPTALERALENAVALGSRLDGAGVDDLKAHLHSALDHAEELTSVAVKGSSATAVDNAQAILDANAAIEKALMDSEAVIEEIKAAQMAAETLEDGSQKTAVERLLAEALEEAEAIMKQAQEYADATGAGSIAMAVAAVEGADEEGTPAKIGEGVAEEIKTALGTLTTTATAFPAGAVRMNDADAIKAMTFAEIVGEANTKMVPLGTDRAMITVGSIMGATAADVNAALTETGGTGGGRNYADGTMQDTSTYKGITGTAYCLGSDCSVDRDGKLAGSWYFAPTSPSARYMKSGSTYTAATMFAEYGYWLIDSDSDGAVDGVGILGSTGGANTAGLDLLQGDADEAVEASYEGSALGFAEYNKKSGEFTAAVSLTATFGEAIADSNLSGRVSGFEGVANPAWVVTLSETALGADGALTANGAAYGGTAAGAWTAQGYGTSGERPAGFTGWFNANFADGIAAGAYATRAAEE